MNIVVYEAEPFYGFNLHFIVFLIITILLIVLLAIFWKKIDLGVKCFISIIIVFFMMIIFSQIFVSVDAKKMVYNKYQNGEYFVVEGVISDYTIAEKSQPNLPDCFLVNDIEFQVPGFVSAWGYPLKKIDGGILENGMHVKVYYIEYKSENVIMKIEHLINEE